MQLHGAANDVLQYTSACMPHTPEMHYSIAAPITMH